MWPDRTAPIGTVCSGYTLFVSILKSSVMLGIYLQMPFFRGFFYGVLGVEDKSSHLCMYLLGKRAMWIPIYFA